MARKATFTKEQIVAKALQIVREEGVEGITARSLGAALGSSSSPIFTHFNSMDEVLLEVGDAAKKMFDEYVSDVVDYMPAFKEFGIRLVRFARQEPRLFNYIFDQIYPSNCCSQPVASQCLDGIEKVYGLNKEQTMILFRQLWIQACGLAMMGTRQPELYNDDVVSEMLSYEFAAMMTFFKSGRQVTNIQPHKHIEGENEVMVF